MKGLLFTLLYVLVGMNTAIAKEIVTISGNKGNWQLKINRQPFYIKGVGCGLHKGSNGEDYLKLAKEVGANTVRTWGTDAGNEEYLNTAEKYGLKVIAGIWMNYVCDDGRFSYITDTEYMEAKKQEIIEYVNKFKNHPAILMWNIGNETIYFTKSEKERIAFCKYLEKIIKVVKQFDPSHPVIYASANITAIPYIKEYVPSLDILGMNVYDSIFSAHNKCISELNIPYIITEYGPRGWWNSPKDINQKSIEPSDDEKATWYRDHMRQIYRLRGYNLGGVAHHLGETTQETFTWWNINYKNFKTASYWMLYELYTGNKVANNPPTIKNLQLSKTTNIKPGETIELKTTVEDLENDQLSYSYLMSTSQEGVTQYYVNEEIPVKVIGKGAIVKIKLADDIKDGIYRVYVFVYEYNGNIAAANTSISVRR